MKISKLLLLAASVLAAGNAFAEKVVIGRLGQTTVATKIYAAPTTHSRVYWKLKPYEYLVLRSKPAKGYYRVMLSNGADGYVVAEKVAQLPNEVTMETRSSRSLRGYTASRGGSVRSMGGTDARAQVAAYATKFEGVPYKWGGTSLSSGLDCSAFVQKMFGAIGVDLPRTAAEQVRYGQPISRLEDLRAGDRLYFWSTKRNMIGHTGIYLGNGYFVNASSGHGQVVTDYLGKPYWLKMLVAARR